MFGEPNENSEGCTPIIFWRETRRHFCLIKIFHFVNQIEFSYVFRGVAFGDLLGKE